MNRIFLLYENQVFIRTDDLGFKKENQLYLTGTIKNLIIRSGENIITEDIERRIERYPRIHDVVVCGVPDSQYGEEVCTCLEIVENEIELDKLKEK